MEQILSIGALAKRASTKVQTIRFYEQEGLMPSPSRSDGGQRRYTKAHADRLAFIRHSRELGFPLDAIRELLGLTDEPEQSCQRVDHVAREVLADVEAKIERLEALRKVNPTVSETEILLLKFNRDNMLKAMEKAELSLDSLRIIIS